MTCLQIWLFRASDSVLPSLCLWLGSQADVLYWIPAVYQALHRFASFREGLPTGRSDLGLWLGLASYSSSRILYFVVPLVVQTRNMSFTLHLSFSLQLISDEVFMSCPLSLLKIFLPVPLYSGLGTSVSVSWNRCLTGPFSSRQLASHLFFWQLKKKKKKSPSIKCPSLGWVKKLACPYDGTLPRNKQEKPLIPTTTWRNPKGIEVYERCQSQKLI